MRTKQTLIIVAVVQFIILLGILALNPLFFLQQKLPVVMVINIDGEIISTQFYGVFEKRGQMRTHSTSATNILRLLEYFSQDKNVKAFILEINAYGGQNAGQEEIARYIQHMEKPVVTVIKGSALASGYYVAVSADKVYADPLARIGHIGKTFAYVNRERNGQEQVCFINSMNFLDAIIDDCPGFEQDVFSMLRRHVAITHLTLISNIASMRGLDKNELLSLSESEVTSKEALEHKLIDEIGTTEDALAWLEQEIGTTLWLVNVKDILRDQP